MVSQTNTNRGRGQRDRRGRKDEEKSPYIEKVVSVRRVSKVVKGGRNLSFAAFVVIGDEKGKVGYSSGKAAAPMWCWMRHTSNCREWAGHRN